MVINTMDKYAIANKNILCNFSKKFRPYMVTLDTVSVPPGFHRSCMFLYSLVQDFLHIYVYF